MTVYEILNKIQVELKAPKNQRNDFGKYNYRSCEDILEAVKPLLSGSVVVISDEIVLIGDRYYVRATATITYDGQSISCSAYARESENRKGMDDAQITGATSSYSRKYCANGLFLIDDTKDADTKDNTGKDDDKDKKETKSSSTPSPKEPPKQGVITDKERVRLFSIGSKTKLTTDVMKKITAACGYSSSKDILEIHYKTIVDFIEQTPSELIDENLPLLAKLCEEITNAKLQ